MSDFEDQVRSALKAGVDDELSAVGLADGARSRLRRRRRTTSVVVGAAVAVLAVPVGLAMVDRGSAPGNGRGPEVAGATDAAAPGLPAGWHWESWRNVEFGVPDTWKHGSSNQWCVSGDLNQAWVSRPNEAQTLVACLDPMNGYGASIIPSEQAGTPKTGIWQYPDAGNEYPQGSWLTTLVSGETAVVVVAPDRATVETIADSFRTFSDHDANGCGSSWDTRKAPAVNVSDDGAVTVCHYLGSGQRTNNLAGSYATNADRGAAIRAAVDQALAGKGTTGPMADCAAVDPDGWLVLLDGAPLAIVYSTGCSDSGVARGDERGWWTQELQEALFPELTAPGDDPVVNPEEPVSNDGTVSSDGSTGSDGSSKGGGSDGSTASEGTVEPVAPDASPVSAE